MKLVRSNISKLPETGSQTAFNSRFERKLSAGYSKHRERTISRATIFLAIVNLSKLCEHEEVGYTISRRNNFNFSEQILLIEKFS